MLEAELQVFAIFVGEGGNAQGNAGKIDALVFSQQTTVNDLALDIVTANANDAEFDQSIGEKNAFSGLNFARKLREEIDVPFRRFGDERDILTLYVSQVTQSLPERALLRRIVGGRRRLICEHADTREFVRLLRIGGEGQQTLAQ